MVCGNGEQLNPFALDLAGEIRNEIRRGG